MANDVLVGTEKLSDKLYLCHAAIPKYKTIKEHLQHFFDLCLLQRFNLAKTSLSRLCVIASNPLGLHGLISGLLDQPPSHGSQNFTILINDQAHLQSPTFIDISRVCLPAQYLGTQALQISVPKDTLGNNLLSIPGSLWSPSEARMLAR